MKLTIDGDVIITSQGRIKAPYPVIDAREIEGVALVLYNYMAFPLNKPARNLFAYDLSGNPMWRAEDIGYGATDAYTNIFSETPLVVGNFSCVDCTIDVATGKVLDKRFTK
jgi:hypothetical protein